MILLRTLALPLAVASMVALLSGCQRQDFVASGREYMAAGNVEAATLQFRNAVQAAPESAELRVLLADALERKHDLAGAQTQLERALALGGDTDILVPRVALLMVDRDELDALVRGHADTRLADPTADSSLRGTVALAMLGQGKSKAARAQLEQAATPTASVRLAQAQLLVADGKAGDALGLLHLAEGEKADPWWTLRAAKRIAVGMGDSTRALAYMKRAHESVPWHGGVLGEYAEALITADRAAEAEALRQRLRKQHPGLFWTHYVDALLLHRSGRFEESHAAALRALRAAPEHLPSQLMAASTELQMGDLLVAQRRLQALLRKYPKSLPGWQLYAQVQARLGQSGESAAAVKRGLELSPDDNLLLGLQADQQMAAGQFKPAIAALTTLLAARPTDVDAMLKLARARFVSGDKQGALELVARASQIAGDAAAGARVVAMALRLGRPDLARNAAEQNMARHPEDPQARLSFGAVQSARNDRAGAWKTTLQVLDQQPAHAGALQALTAQARTTDELQVVLARHRAAIDSGVRAPQIHLDYAGLLREVPGRTADTPRSVLDKAVQAEPTAVALREALIDQLLREGDKTAAITVAQTGAAVAYAPPAAAALLAVTYERLGDAQQAAEVWRKLVAAHPERSDWRMRLAHGEAELGRDAEAMTLLRKLIDDRAFDIRPYLLLARLQAATDIDAALATAKQLGLQPEFKAASLLLAGDVLASGRRSPEALEQYELAAKAGAGVNATLRQVDLLDATGSQDAATQRLEAAIRRQPDEASLVTKAAQRALQRGKAPEAIDLLQRLADRAAGDGQVLNDLAWAQLAAGRTEALANARRAAALLPNQPEVLHTLGMALSKAGRSGEAIEVLRASTNLAPGAAQPRLDLAQLLAIAGDKAGATQALSSIDGAQLQPEGKQNLERLKAQLGAT